jgi:hypothetical protein
MEFTREQLEAMLPRYEQAGDLDAANKIRYALGMPRIDENRGATMGARMAESASRGEGAPLDAVRNFYPEARPFGQDNYLINNGQALFNPPGFDMGDLSMAPRIGAEAAGGLLGGFLGLPGGIPGAMVGAAAGATTAGTLYDAGMRAFGGAENTENPGETIGRMALEAAYGSMSGPLEPGMSPVAAGVDDMVTRLTEPRRGAIEAMNAGGVMPTAGQRGNGVAQRIEGALESSTFGGPIMDQQRQAAVDLFGETIEGMTPMAGTRETAGDRVTSGLRDSTENMRGQVSQAYGAFDDALFAAGEGMTSRIPMNNLMQASKEFDNLVARDQGFARMVYQDPDLSAAISSMKGMIANAERNLEEGTNLPEEPTYQVIKDLRSIIGRKIDDAFYQGGEKNGLKRLYSILSDDLGEGVEMLAGEAGVQARSRADSLNAQMMNRLERLSPIFRNVNDPGDPENMTRVYTALESSMMNNPELFAEARREMGEEAFNQFRQTWLNRAARATPGAQDETGEVFSPNRFLTAITKLRQQSPESYEVLTYGLDEGIGVAREMAAMLRESERFINRSRTGNTMGFNMDLTGGGLAGTLGMAAGRDPMTSAAIGMGVALSRPVSQYLLAKAFTSPSLNRALAKVGRQGRQFDARTLSRALVVAGADPDEVEEIFGTGAGSIRPPLRAAGNG